MPCESPCSSATDDDLEEVERATSRTGTDMLDDATLDEYSKGSRTVLVAGMNQGYGSVPRVDTGGVADGHEDWYEPSIVCTEWGSVNRS